MSEFYDEIMAAIVETEAAAKENKLKITMFVRPVRQYQAKRIKQIRQSLHMTQAIFAGVMGVSKKTVEAWEAGRNTPMGPASRILDLFAEDSSVAKRFLLYSRSSQHV